MINSETERLFSHMKFSLACTRSSQKETVTYLSAYFFLFSSLNKGSYLLESDKSISNFKDILRSLSYSVCLFGEL